MRHLKDTWYWSSAEYPSRNVNLRNISGAAYTIEDTSEGSRVIGTMDEVSAMTQLHDGAVYIHGAETYFVDKLDTEQKVARVKRQDLDYYTQAVTASQIQVEEKEDEQDWRGGVLGYGDVTVTTTIPMFRKIRFHSRDSLGAENLELPPQVLETVAFWFAPPSDLVDRMKDEGLPVGDALTGIANVVVEVAPLFVMCDVQDIGAVVDARNLGRDALFVHDRYPGGMGYASRCLERFEEMMGTVRDVIRDCGCEDGCPSCVGAATPAFAMTDLDSGVRGRIPDKKAAAFLLEGMLGR
jgi:DEAD/DEAH box helicase domain-containing protein